MTKKEKIEQEVRQTLESFDQAERLKSNPFLYTRLKARIEELDAQRRQSNGWEIACGVIKPALLLLIIALNIFTATIFLKNRNNKSSSREQLLNSFAHELTLDSSQYNPNLLINEQE